MKKALNTDITILGAGISGLAAAHFLSELGYSICVLEKNDRAGGAIRSERRDGFLIEYGPNSTLETTPLLQKLFSDLEILDNLEYANDRAKNRYIVRDGKLNALPMSPPAFIKTRLFSTAAKLRLLREPFIKPASPDSEECLADFVERRIGREFLDYAINPFVAGVYAGKPENLSVKSAFPKLYQLEQDYGSLIKGAILGAKKRRKRAETAKPEARLLSFKNGLQMVTDSLHQKYHDQVYLNAQIKNISQNTPGFEIDFESGGSRFQVHSRTILSTIPAHVYSTLPFSFDFPLSDVFSNIYYPPVAMVYFGYQQAPESIPLDGFGFLVPEKENRNILGTIWSSTIFSERAPQGGVALTTFVGGCRQPEIAQLPDDELIKTVQSDLKELMKIAQNPDLVVIQRWTKAIPQYEIGHQKIMSQIQDFENHTPGLFITGNFRNGISVGDCVKNAHEMSELVGAYIQNTFTKNIENENLIEPEMAHVKDEG